MHPRIVVVLPATYCWLSWLSWLQVVERPAGETWADDFTAAAAGPSSSGAWAGEFSRQQQQQQQPGAATRPRDWADEFAAGVANINLDEFGTEEQLEAAWAAMGGEDIFLRSICLVVSD